MILPSKSIRLLCLSILLKFAELPLLLCFSSEQLKKIQKNNKTNTITQQHHHPKTNWYSKHWLLPLMSNELVKDLKKTAWLMLNISCFWTSTVGKDALLILHCSGEVFISGVFPVGLTALCRTDLVSTCAADFLFRLKMSSWLQKEIPFCKRTHFNIFLWLK